MNLDRYIITLVAALLLCWALILSCSMPKEGAMLEYALRQAGSNRTELEKVLDYYADDSLKLEAAKFLISNMPGHYSYADTIAIRMYAIAVDSIVENMSEEKDFNVVRDSIDSKAHQMGIDTLEIVQDCRIITADFLIQNIDTAFHDWQQGLWARHVSFEDFCEMILPYKVEELQPLDNWRSRLKTFHADRLGDLDCCDQLRHSPLAAAKILNGNLADTLKPVTGLSVRNVHIPMEHRVHLPFGQCGDYANMAATIMRSHGIPIAVDFTPQWARRSLGHTWNVLLSDDGRRIPFGGISAKLGELHKYNEKMAKVYRHTYSSNKELIEMNNSGEQIPGLFRNVFMRDVTKETIQCCDVTIDIGRTDNRYAYLLVFDNHGWVPVAYGKVKGTKSTFRDMGQNVMYLPALYSDGMLKPTAPPFVLEYDGHVRQIVLNGNKRQDLALNRKYPVMEYAYEYIPRLKDGEFQASNDPKFRKYYVVHRIEKGKAAGQYVSVPNSIPACRYWRYKNDRYSTFCSIAEVMLYSKDDTVRLRGKVIGTDGSWSDDPKHTKETVFDGDILTSFDAPRGEGCWAGLDLARQVKVDHIIYYARGDGNSVEIGDEYELLYWRNDQWESLGRHKARQTYIKYKNIPVGGLYLLRDLTKGIDERIFTIEDGKQVWW